MNLKLPDESPFQTFHIDLNADGFAVTYWMIWLNQSVVTELMEQKVKVHENNLENAVVNFIW